MRSSVLAAAAAALALSQVAQAGVTAWHMDGLGGLTNERLDPIVSPNALSAHMHDVAGGSAFSAAYDRDRQGSSNCTTAYITADKSNYWMPKLYWMNNGGESFVPLPAFRRFYYFLGRPDTNTPVSAFPKGLRMVIGNPNAKNDSSWGNGGTGETDVQFRFTCHVNSDLSTGDINQENFNYERDCPYGIRIENKFPSCWDGVNLYKEDMSHMAWPVGPNAGLFNGNCPVSHPTKIPQILLEYTFHPSAYDPAKGKPTKGNLVWANGDTTGYGVHADFAEGWDTDLLHAALNDEDCGNRGSAMPFPDCAIWKQHYDPDAAQACKPQFGTLAEFDSGNVELSTIKALPGCNVPWSAGPKPGCTAPTASPDLGLFKGSTSSLVATGGWNTGNNALAAPTDGYTEVACVSDVFSTFFDLNVGFQDPNMTLTSCRDACARSGFRYSAVGERDGNRQVCSCGTRLLASSPNVPSYCTNKCPGNSDETCGGLGARTVSYNPDPPVSLGSNGLYGCYLDPSGDWNAGLHGAAVYQFTSASMTWETCTSSCKAQSSAYTWAGIWRGEMCMCGTEVRMGGQTFVPLDLCTTPCKGDAGQKCGALYGKTVFSLTGERLVQLNGTAISPLVPGGGDGTDNTTSSGPDVSVGAGIGGNDTSSADAVSKTPSALGDTHVSVAAASGSLATMTTKSATSATSSATRTAGSSGSGVALALPSSATGATSVCKAKHRRAVRMRRRHNAGF